MNKKDKPFQWGFERLKPLSKEEIAERERIEAFSRKVQKEENRRMLVTFLIVIILILLGAIWIMRKDEYDVCSDRTISTQEKAELGCYDDYGDDYYEFIQPN